METPKKMNDYFVTRYSLIPDVQIDIETFLEPQNKEDRFFDWLQTFNKVHHKDLTYRNHNYVLYCKQLNSKQYVISFAKQTHTSVGQKTDTGIEDISIDDYKKCTILLDISSQFMIIEKNYEIANSIEAQKNAIARIFTKFLSSKHMYIELALFTEKNDFWSFVTANKGHITDLEIQLISPNMLGGIKTVSEFLHELNNNYNNTSTSMKLSNPEGNLVISPDNSFIKDAILYSSAGCGKWKVRTTSEKKYSSEDSPVIMQLTDDVLSLNSDALQDINYVFERLNQIDPINQLKG